MYRQTKLPVVLFVYLVLSPSDRSCVFSINSSGLPLQYDEQGVLHHGDSFNLPQHLECRVCVSLARVPYSLLIKEHDYE